MTTTTKYQTYPKYKPSGIDWLGDIPEEWVVKRLKYISNTRVSNVDKKSEDEIQVKLCNYIDVYKNEFINEKIDFMIATATSDQISSFELKTGDVILTKDSEEPDDIGIPAHVDLKDTKNVVCGYHLAIATPHDSVLLGKYLFRLFQSNIFRSYFEVSSHGVTRFGLDAYSIFNADIVLPSLPEQHVIADYLERETARIDDVVEKKQKLIELLLEKRQAIISQAVTKGLNPKAKMKNSRVEWIGQIPENWEIKKIKRLCLVKRGASPRPIEDPKYFDDSGEYGWVRISDVTASDRYLLATEQKLSELGKSLSVPLEPEEIFLSIAGSVGKPIITKVKCCIHDGFVYFYRLNFNREYLYYIFAAGEAYKGLGKLGTQLNLNTDTVGDIFIPIPTEEEQRDIVKYLDRATYRISLLIKKIEQQNQKLQEFRQALISNVVTGKVRVS